MRHDRTVIGYHGCDATVAKRLLAGEPFRPSHNDFDWLGPGVYFWEYGAARAGRWADQQRRSPAVVGAVIQLGRCFDLMDTFYTDRVAQAYPAWKHRTEALGLPLPTNKGHTPDRKGRFLDCAVLTWLLDELEGEGEVFDTVRCGFVEGDPVFEGSKIHRESHVQLAIRNPACILGVFRATIEGP